jgi:hypothetical protein
MNGRADTCRSRENDVHEQREKGYDCYRDHHPQDKGPSLCRSFRFRDSAISFPRVPKTVKCIMRNRRLLPVRWPGRLLCGNESRVVCTFRQRRVLFRCTRARSVQIRHQADTLAMRAANLGSTVKRKAILVNSQQSIALETANDHER